jgi:integrase/recombinase XerC
MRQAGKSKDNATTHCEPVIHFSDFLEARSKTLLTAESPDCEDWLKSLTDAGNVDRTRAKKLQLLRTFYKWLKNTRGATFDPTKFSRVRKTWTDEPRSESEEKIYESLDEARESAHVEGASPLDIRNWAALELLYGSAGRRSEIVRLNLEDLSFEECNVLLHGKLSNDRYPPITDAARDAVAYYLKNARPQLLERLNKNLKNKDLKSKDLKNKGHKDEPLFLSNQGRRLGPGGMGNIVKKALPDSSPHRLRHSHAQHRADAGDRIENIQMILGHAKITTTMIYIPKVSFDQLQSEHRRCHPRGRNCQMLQDRRGASPLPPGEGQRIDHPSSEVHP